MPAPVSVAQIHKFPFGLPCDTFSCVKPAKWQIGRPDGPLSVNHKLCDDCARDVLSNIPEELRTLEPAATAKSEPARIGLRVGEDGRALFVNADTDEQLSYVTFPEGMVLVRADALQQSAPASDEPGETDEPEDVAEQTDAAVATETATCVCGRSFSGKMAKQHLARHQQTCEVFTTASTDREAS